MLCQKFMKTLKFVCNYQQMLSHVNYTCLYHPQKYRYCANLHIISSESFRTSASFALAEKNEDLYYFECGRRLAKHVEDPNMPKVKITFIDKDGNAETVEDARVGNTVIEVALKNHVPMEASCERKKACTTCHCYVEEKDQKFFTPPDLDEEDLLDIAPFVKPTSRLGCQLKIIKQFDHMTIRLPKGTKNFAVDK